MTRCTILRDRRFGREIPAEVAPEIPRHLAPFYAIEAHSMLELEPPRHTRLRGLVLRAFTSRRIAAMADEIERLADELIDAFPDGPFDLLDAYARPLPVTIIARLLGVPDTMAWQLLDWSNAMVRVYQAARSRKDEDAAAAAAKAFAGYLRARIEALMAAPDGGLISELIAVREADGDRLSADELISTVILLLNAGHEATVHTLGNGVKLLLNQRQRSIDDAVVEEILRCDPPLHIFSRWAYEDVDLFGHRFARGDRVDCLLASAGRDADVFETPESFDATRKPNPHAAFGGGIHFCVGAPLARLELRIALDRLMTRCPDLRIEEPPRYADMYHFHGLERLVVRR